MRALVPAQFFNRLCFKPSRKMAVSAKAKVVETQLPSARSIIEGCKPHPGWVQLKGL